MLRIVELVVCFLPDEELPARRTFTVGGRLQIQIRWVMNHITRFDGVVLDETAIRKCAEIPVGRPFWVLDGDDVLAAERDLITN